MNTNDNGNASATGSTVRYAGRGRGISHTGALWTFAVLISTLSLSCGSEGQEVIRPNILWLTSEDNSPFLGCYGDPFATTPNLDRLAERGFRYTHAYANAPVCAPARNTIITGVYANSGGNQYMRSRYPKSSEIRFFPDYLRQAGYYCTNNSKEDYNIDPVQTADIWDESSPTAHYKNRSPGQPFFAVFNCVISHESSIHSTIPTDQLRHRPEMVVLPPYHPDTPEMRHDWAQYYDKVEDMDTWVGEKLRELEESGEADNTIIFYYGDHGGVLGRSKRYVYESGTRVPFIVYIPDKYRLLYPTGKPGYAVDRLISFVDLAPTLLSILGLEIPGYMQGKAFLGSKKTDAPQYAYMFRDRMDERVDMSRAVRDSQFRYIRNYMPHRIYGQYLEYLWRAPSMRSWEAAWLSGICNEVQSRFWNAKPAEELYDTENDPWEVYNLADNPDYSEVLERMREALHGWMLRIGDTGFIPEVELSELSGDIGAYSYMRMPEVDLGMLIGAAEMASGTTPPDLAGLLNLLQSDNVALRYWGATGLLLQGEAARPVLPQIAEVALTSPSSISVLLAEILYRLGEREGAKPVLLSAVRSTNPFLRNQALNIIDEMGEISPEVQRAVITMVQMAGDIDRSQYDMRSAKRLFEKWGIDPAVHGIAMDW